MSVFYRFLLAAGLFSSNLAGAMTLAQAVDEARAASPDARAAEARVAIADAARTGSDAALFPQVVASASYMQTNSPMNAFGAILNTGTFDDSINFNRPGQMDAATLSLYLRQPLYTGGRIAAGRASARAMSEAALFEKDAALAALDVSVVRGYFAIRQAGESVKALEAALASYEENLRVARLREQAGQLLASERLNLEVQKARTESLLLEAHQQEALARAYLAVLLGLKADASPELADSDPTLVLLADPGETAHEPWPELRAMDGRVRAATEAVSIAKSGKRPEVGAFAGVDGNKSWRRDGDGESWTAGVSVSMNVFDGKATDAKVAAAYGALDEARALRRKVELALELRLQQAKINHAVALSQLEVCRRQVEQAEESARLSRERFSAGALLSAELIGVESRLADARVQLAKTQSLERVTMAELRLALGLPVIGTH